VSMMSERGIGLAHTTILRWVQHYTPEFEKRWQRYARPVGGSWRMDETYVKVRGEWVYLYRAVDKAGKTVDFFLSRQRDINAAKAFLRKAMNGQRLPAKVTLDAYAASHRAVADLKDSAELPKRVVVRSSKYLNNLIEQDHRRIKQRLRPMLGLKSFETADIVISRTGSSKCETKDLAGEGLRVSPDRLADTARDRSDGHDQEGESAEGRKGRHGCPGQVHR